MSSFLWRNRLRSGGALPMNLESIVMRRRGYVFAGAEAITIGTKSAAVGLMLMGNSTANKSAGYECWSFKRRIHKYQNIKKGDR